MNLWKRVKVILPESVSIKLNLNMEEVNICIENLTTSYDARVLRMKHIEDFDVEAFLISKYVHGIRWAIMLLLANHLIKEVIYVL